MTSEARFTKPREYKEYYVWQTFDFEVCNDLRCTQFIPRHTCVGSNVCLQHLGDVQCAIAEDFVVWSSQHASLHILKPVTINQYLLSIKISAIFFSLSIVSQ